MGGGCGLTADSGMQVLLGSPSRQVLVIAGRRRAGTPRRNGVVVTLHFAGSGFVFVPFGLVETREGRVSTIRT